MCHGWLGAFLESVCERNVYVLQLSAKNHNQQPFVESLIELTIELVWLIGLTIEFGHNCHNCHNSSHASHMFVCEQPADHVCDLSRQPGYCPSHPGKPWDVEDAIYSADWLTRRTLVRLSR